MKLSKILSLDEILQPCKYAILYDKITSGESERIECSKYFKLECLEKVFFFIKKNLQDFTQTVS